MENEIIITGEGAAGAASGDYTAEAIKKAKIDALLTHPKGLMMLIYPYLLPDKSNEDTIATLSKSHERWLNLDSEIFDWSTFSEEATANKLANDMIASNIFLGTPDILDSTTIDVAVKDPPGATQKQIKFIISFKIGVKSLRKFLSEKGLLKCRNGEKFPCQDKTTILKIPTHKFKSPEKAAGGTITAPPAPTTFDLDAEGYDLFSWPGPENQKGMASVEFADGAAEQSLIGENEDYLSPGTYVSLASANLFAPKDPNNPDKQWISISWVKVEILSSSNQKQVGRMGYVSKNDLIEVTVEEAKEWLDKQAVKMFQENPPHTSLTNFTPVPNPPTLVLPNATHVVRVPYFGMPPGGKPEDDIRNDMTGSVPPYPTYEELDKQGLKDKAAGFAPFYLAVDNLRWPADANGARMPTLPRDTQVKIIEQNVGSLLQFHKVLLVDPKQLESRLSFLGEGTTNGDKINNALETIKEKGGIPGIIYAHHLRVLPLRIASGKVVMSSDIPGSTTSPAAAIKLPAYNHIPVKRLDNIDSWEFPAEEDLLANNAWATDQTNRLTSDISCEPFFIKGTKRNPSLLWESKIYISVPCKKTLDPKVNKKTMHGAALKGLIGILEYYDKNYSLPQINSWLLTVDDFVEVIKFRPKDPKEKSEVPGVPPSLINGVALVSLKYKYLEAFGRKPDKLYFDDYVLAAGHRTYQQVLDQHLKQLGNGVRDPAAVDALISGALQQFGAGVLAQMKKIGDQVQPIIDGTTLRRVTTSNAHEEDELETARYPTYGKDIVAFTTTYKWGKLHKDIKRLKKVIKWYDRKMKKSKKKLEAYFPGFSGKLQLSKDEIGEIDNWTTSLNEFLGVNDDDWNQLSREGKGHKKAAKSRPAKPHRYSTIEFGWNTKFELIYILFQGAHLRIGIECFKKNSSLARQRTSAFIHRMPMILKDFRKRKRRWAWSKWVQKNVYPLAIIRPSLVKRKGRMKAKLASLRIESNRSPIKTSTQKKKLIRAKNNPDLNKANKNIQNKAKINALTSVVNDLRGISKGIKTVSGVYDFLLNKLGFQTLIDEIMACYVENLPGPEQVILKMLLGQSIGDIEQYLEGEENEDLEKGVEILKKILELLPEDCAKELLNSIFEIGGEKPSITDTPVGVHNINQGSLPPTDPTSITEQDAVGDYVVFNTANDIPPGLLLTGDPVVDQMSQISGSQVPLREAPSYTSKAVAVLPNATKVSVESRLGQWYVITVKQQGQFEGKKGHVKSSMVVPFTPPGQMRLLDGTQLNRKLGADGEPMTAGNGEYWGVTVAQDFKGAAKNTEGWVKSAFLKPISAKAKLAADQSAVFIKPGSRDKRNGLYNEVFQWQRFLSHNPKAKEWSGIGKLKGTKGPPKEPSLRKWKYGGKIGGNWTGKQGKMTTRATKEYWKNRGAEEKGDQMFYGEQKTWVTVEEFKTAKKAKKDEVLLLKFLYL